MRQTERRSACRGHAILYLLDTGLQALAMLALAVAIIALHMRLPCHLYLLAAPILPMVAWICCGLVIDRQALRAPVR